MHCLFMLWVTLLILWFETIKFNKENIKKIFVDTLNITVFLTNYFLYFSWYIKQHSTMRAYVIKGHNDFALNFEKPEKS